MKTSNKSTTLIWVVLLIATAIPPVTTRGDEWTGWTVYSLVGATVCIVALIVPLVRSQKSTAK